MSRIIEYFAGLDIWGWLEILAMVVGFYYVLLEIRKTKLLWYVCIVTSILNIFVYQHNSYISMTLIQFYYILTSVYGIWSYRRLDREADAEYGADTVEGGGKVAIKRFDWKVGLVTVAVAVAVYFLLVPFLLNYAAQNPEAFKFASQPYWDAFVAVGSMVGTFFLSKSYMCQWYIWIALDILTVGLFIYSGMYWMAILYVSYIVMSCFGIRNWRRKGVYVD